MNHYYRNRYLIAAYIQACYLTTVLRRFRFRCPNAAEYTASNPLVVPAEHYGAMAYVIIGNTANTRFTIKASAKQDAFNTSGKRIDTDIPFPTTEMVYQTNAKAGATPEFALTALAVYQYDEQGNRTDAGKAGSLFPEKLTAALFYHQEGYEPAVDASGNYYLKGIGVFTTSKVNNGQVKFTPMQGGGSVSPSVQTIATDGQYSTDLTLGALPALNVIQAVGSASVAIPAIDPTSGTVSMVTTNLSGATEFRIWGVKLAIEPTKLVLINSEGYLVKDTEIRFTIEPSNYPYSTKSLYLDFYEKDTLGNESWMGFVQADLSGKIILSQGGVKFNSEHTYSVQLIVDRGMKKEVVSAKVALPVAQLRVLTDENGEYPKNMVDEIKFGRGDINRPEKIYHIELRSSSLINTCANLSGKISVIDKTGQPITPPSADGRAYAAEYQFNATSIPTGCQLQFIDTLDGGNKKNKLITANRSRADLNQGWFNSNDVSDKAVLYGGIGNQIKVQINEAKKILPIEPVGVVVLGIDGLRQDVLYSPQGSGTDVKASYADPNGCITGSCNVQPANLQGLCDVMGGKYSSGFIGIGSGCDPMGWENRHIKLPNVTAIFPSITFASWASILTGKMPSEPVYNDSGQITGNNGTGILGNEFFARDLYQTSPTSNNIPGLRTFPPGMVTLDADGGAFYPGGMWFAIAHAIPAEFSSSVIFSGADMLQKKMNASAPNTVLKAEPFWSSINTMVGSKYTVIAKNENGFTTARCDQSNNECGTVSMYNQYARGADWWGTPSNAFVDLFNGLFSKSSLLSEGAVLDKSATGEATNFIKNYFTQNKPDGKRKRFPAVFSVYLAGLDHDAHLAGMGDYVNYFKSTTDAKVADIVKALNDQGEFDNKISIITADHGHTAMPTDLRYSAKIKKFDPESGTPYYEIKEFAVDMSCTLKTDFKDPNDPNQTNLHKEDELNNNSLHIWELAEVIKQAGFYKGDAGLDFAIMAPQAIASLYDQFSYGAKPDISTANIIAALNGPMAHIYLKNRAIMSWNAPRMVEDIGYVAELLRLSISTNKAPSNLSNLFPVGLFEEDVPILASIERLRNSVNFILVRRNNSYEVFYGIKADGSDILSAPLNNYAEFGSSLYVKALKRIADMNHPDRSGDIVLVMKDFSTGDAINRFTTAYACKSWHGSLNPSDSYVPLILSYPGGNKSEVDKILQNVSACPNGQCEGNWNVTDIIKEIINKQYSNQ